MEIKVDFEHLYAMVDEQNHLKPEYERQLVMQCTGGSPTGFALAAALEDLLARYDTLKQAGKHPFHPILFVLSDGLPVVPPEDKAENDRLLGETIQKIRELVSLDKLRVVAVETGLLCETPRNKMERRMQAEMHTLMQHITGRDDWRDVLQARDSEDVDEFFFSRLFSTD